MTQDSSPKNTADSRELLLDAAKTVFARKGYDGTTVKELAEAAGVNVSLVSYYFNGKEGLYLACLEKLGRDRLQINARILAKVPGSAEEFRVLMRLFIENFIDTNVRDPELTMIVHRECASDLPVAKELFRSVFIKSFENFVAFLRGAQKNGILREDVDMHAPAVMLFGGLIHLIRSDSLSKEFYGLSLQDKDYREKMINDVYRSFTDGLVKAK